MPVVFIQVCSPKNVGSVEITSNRLHAAFRKRTLGGSWEPCNLVEDPGKGSLVVGNPERGRVLPRKGW